MAATPGVAHDPRPAPWYERGRFVSLTPVNTGMGATLHTNHIANLVEQDDARGIAWLRTNLRGLLDAHEQALCEVEASRNRVADVQRESGMQALVIEQQDLDAKRLRSQLTELRGALADLPIVRCDVVVTEIDAILKGAP